MTLDPKDGAPALVPLDHDPVQPGFDIVLRGYDRGQVDRQLNWLEEQLGAADREMESSHEALRQARQEAADAKQQAQRAAAELDRGRPTFEALGKRIAQMLTLAEQEAEALLGAARSDVERTHKELGAEQAVMRRETQDQRRGAEQEAATIVERARQEAQRVVTDARRHAAEVTQAGQRQVDAMSRQRDAIHAELVRVQERFAAVMGSPVDLAAGATTAKAATPEARNEATDDTAPMQAPQRR